MEIVWSSNAHDQSGRKRAAKACQKCHANKKRCLHNEAITSYGSPTVASVPENDFPGLKRGVAVDREGDLVPKSILTDLSPEATGAGSTRSGTHHERLPIRQLSLHDPRSMLDRFRYSSSSAGNISEVRSRYLRSAGAYDALPKSTTDMLIPIYVSQINGCFPILDGCMLQRSYFNDTASQHLVKAICLIVCKTDEATPFLRLSETGPTVSPGEFADRLYVALDAALNANLEQDRLAKAQILALMHVHHDSATGLEEASKRLSQAIHDCHTLSLHYLEPGRDRDDEPSLLWWSLWTLDKMNSCVASRPMMLSKTNMSLPLPSLGTNYQSKMMRAWLALSEVLQQIYQIYIPPDEREEWEEPFPRFDEVCAFIDSKDVQSSHLATLNLYYNTIAMLSCRAGLVGSVPYGRRSAAADEIQRLSKETGARRLLPIPLVPYSLSLALTVAYRDLRDEHKSAAKAYEDLQSRCDMLDALSPFWPSAAAMVQLGRAAIQRSLSTKQSHGSDTALLSQSVAQDQDFTPEELHVVPKSGCNNAKQTQNLQRSTEFEPGNPNSNEDTDRCPIASDDHGHAATSPLIENTAEQQASEAFQNGDSFEDLFYDDLDSIFGPTLNTGWFHMSQDMINFGDSVTGED